MSSEAVYLFVYGTLRRDAGHLSHRLLANDAELVGRARMSGGLFEIDNYPGAVPSEGGERWVLGELYRLLKPAVVLAALDAYEETTEEYPEPREYRRCRVTVEREDGTQVNAWCYIYNRPTAGLRLIPGGDWCDESR